MGIFGRARSILGDREQFQADRDWTTVSTFYQEHRRGDVDQRRRTLDAFAKVCSSIKNWSTRKKFVDTSVEWLEQVLSSDLDAICRVTAARLLGVVGVTNLGSVSDRLTASALRLALYEDADPDVRAECAKQLGYVGCHVDSPVGPLNVHVCSMVHRTLVRAYQAESHERVRASLFVAITGFDGITEGTRAIVRAALEDTSVEIREHAQFLVEESEADAAQQAAAADLAARRD